MLGLTCFAILCCASVTMASSRCHVPRIRAPIDKDRYQIVKEGSIFGAAAIQIMANDPKAKAAVTELEAMSLGGTPPHGKIKLFYHADDSAIRKLGATRCDTCKERANYIVGVRNPKDHYEWCPVLYPYIYPVFFKTCRHKFCNKPYKAGHVSFCHEGNFRKEDVYIYCRTGIHKVVIFLPHACDCYKWICPVTKIQH